MTRGADPQLAGSLYRSEEANRPTIEIATAIEPEPMKAELLERLARAVSTS